MRRRKRPSPVEIVHLAEQDAQLEILLTQLGSLDITSEYLMWLEQAHRNGEALVAEIKRRQAEQRAGTPQPSREP
jgi:hypothetical protein